MSRRAPSRGQDMLAFAAQLYPICRSISGAGVRHTLKLIRERIPLRLHEVPSGTQAFDWQVPLEWNIDDACVLDPHGQRVVDFKAHNLHIVSYSEPISMDLPLAELKTRLHAHASHPDWIPYRTSYYRRNWGFCLPRRQLDTLAEGRYGVRIASSLARGSLSYGEFVLPGRRREEVLLFTHICHPSLANDNTSGMAVATALAAWLAQTPRRYSYRLVFAPGTIGSLVWLKRNEKSLARIRYGLVLGLLGDSAPLTYKCSRQGQSEIDRLAPYALRGLDPGSRTLPFEPYGYDERQLCSPGFNLPIGRLTRSVNDGYPQYHSSGDDLGILSAASLEQSLEACQRIVQAIEDSRHYINVLPKGEPRLGKRGLYGTVGGQSPAARELARLWVLNQSDGAHSLLGIAERSQLPIDELTTIAAELTAAKLLRLKADPKPARGRSAVQSPRRSRAKR